jgi:tetratricopeptide (TPR) repeat protein
MQLPHACSSLSFILYSISRAKAKTRTTRFDNDSLTTVQKAFAEYDQKNYPKAITLFKTIPGFEKDQTISFYLAIAYLSINDSKNAEQLLLSLLNKNQAINDKVQWYLGLSYLKNNKISMAVEHFKNLAVTENNYTQNAIKILKKIK